MEDKALIKRIKEMEDCLDICSDAVRKMESAFEIYEKALGSLQKLSDYYGSTQWMSDYEADEEGKIPKEIKRGVLSEDAVYNLITDNHDLNVRMLKCIAKELDGKVI